MLADQNIVEVDGRELIVSVVAQEGSGSVVHARELATGREHRVGLEEGESPTSVEAVVSRLGLNGAGELEVRRTGTELGDAERTRRDVCEKKRVRVRSVTWNLQARATACPVALLRERLLPFEQYHILHVGTQECERSIAASAINPSKAKWLGLLQEAAGPNYEPLISHTLQATHSVVFVHRGILPWVSGMRSAAVATGLGAGETRMGNKGGVGIAFNIGATRVLFVTAHLAAHQKNAAVRDREVAKIDLELTKALKHPVTRTPRRDGDESAPLAEGAGPSDGLGPRADDDDDRVSPDGTPAGGVASAETPQPTSLLDDFDVVVWSGDCNSRVDLSRAEADAALAAGDLGRLQAADQLTVSKAAGRVFSGYTEGPLNFPPTYKFDSVDKEKRDGGDLDVYDTSAKQRVPSWTDRILWAHRKTQSIQLEEYTSIPNLRSSDHRPVVAAWSLDVDLGDAATDGAHQRDVANLHQSQVCAVM